MQGMQKRQEKTGFQKTKGAPQGAPNPETAQIIAALENLPLAIRAGILAPVKAAAG